MSNRSLTGTAARARRKGISAEERTAAVPRASGRLREQPADCHDAAARGALFAKLKALFTADVRNMSFFYAVLKVCFRRRFFYPKKAAAKSFS